MFITLLFDERLLSKSGDGNDEASSFAPPSVLSELEPKLGALPIVDVSGALNSDNFELFLKAQVKFIRYLLLPNTTPAFNRAREESLVNLAADSPR